MCGINGFNWPDKAILEKMNHALRHRGPDGEGTCVDERVSLGHRRLSIIDLSERGKQPMCNEDGSIWLVHNGEIYNFQELRKGLEQKGHVFKSDTDTEVIIHAYEEEGVDCFNHFNGMWAFCIYDMNENKLILSRDRFGIKPLYYYADDQHFIFSSMIAGILCHDIKTSPDDKAIMEYLAFNLLHHQDYTFFKNIYSLMPGSVLHYDLTEKKCAVEQWYQLKNLPESDENAIQESFIASVQARTVSDVPIGSCLSGGMDSSAIVCTLNKFMDGTFNTYSLVVPESPFDETRYIEEIGRVTDTRQFFTTIDEDQFFNEIHDFVVSQEEPVTGMSPYAQYRVMKLAHEQGAKVLLDGQGGDEIFAGYIYYFSYYFYELLRSFRFLTLAKEMMLFLKNFKSFYPHAMFLFLLLPNRMKHFAWNRFSHSWLNHDMLEQLCQVKDPRWQAMDLKGGLLLTLFSTAIPHLLRWEDKNSMRWSIESRVPFLDFRLVELANSLRSEQKLRNGRTKVAFKKAMHGIIPEVISNRKDKIGFAAPVDEFFRSERVVEFSREIINSESFRQRPYWKWNEVNELFTAHIKGKKNIGDTIWKWINLELWMRHYCDE
ncbi:MAG: asparagine synthase (glutamine-hydrolyzing) [Chloroflexi bacterium]|jgi:asparagine synthase (glutamine-hydrolysing)|nr:asparagine synthase (glutamine-hydrolyzing) [Chloroflexota bacterium]